MKKIIYIVGMIALFIGCDAENAWDCFQSTGDIVEENYDVGAFNQIIVWNRVQLILVDGNEQKVTVQTGENLLNEVRVRVEDSILKVSDRNSCNYTRDYGVTKVYVTAPVDTLIVRNSSGLTVENIGKVRHSKLRLFSVDPGQQDIFHIDGDFNLTNLQVESLSIESNGLAKFYLQGEARSGNFSLRDGDTRVEAENLITRKITFFHRSTNSMIIFPTDTLKGTIIGLGNVVAKNRPSFVEVEELNTGRLIFE